MHAIPWEIRLLGPAAVSKQPTLDKIKHKCDLLLLGSVGAPLDWNGRCGWSTLFADFYWALAWHTSTWSLRRGQLTSESSQWTPSTTSCMTCTWPFFSVLTTCDPTRPGPPYYIYTYAYSGGFVLFLTKHNLKKQRCFCLLANVCPLAPRSSMWMPMAAREAALRIRSKKKRNARKAHLTTMKKTSRPQHKI